MTIQRENRQMPMLTLRAAVAPGTINKEARTVELVWTTGAKGLRGGGWSEPYYEELSLDASAVRMDRLNAGAPFLAVHNDGSLSSVLGVVERGWLSATEGRALVRFSKRADVEPYFQDVCDSILRNISVGYMVHRYRRIRSTQEGEPDTLVAVDWEPHELSLVPVGFDAGAQVRAAEKCVTVVIESEGDSVRVWMDQETTDGGASSEEAAEATEEVVTDPTQMQASAEPGDQRTGSALETRAAQEIQVMDNPAPSAADTMQRILAAADQYRQHCPDADRLAGDAIRGGKTFDEFIERVMGSMASRHTDMSQAYIGLNDQEVQQYSIARAVAALVTGNWQQAGLERAASEAVAKKFGREAGGVFVPMDAFRVKRDFTAGTATEAGNLIATDLRADLFTDVLRPQLALAQLGATFLPGLTSNVAIPKKTAAGTMGFVAETAAAAETAPVTGQISMTPHRISTFVEYSKQAVIQSALALEPMLRQDLLDGLAVEVDTAGINGSGSGSNPRGLRNTSGVGAVVGGTNGLAFNWANLVGLETAAANANAINTERAGYLVNTKTVGAAKTTQKAANLPFIWDPTDRPLNGHRGVISNIMPSNLTKGSSSGVCSSAAFGSDWAMLVIALFGAVDITVDGLSKAEQGLMRIILNHFIDVGTRLPAAFAVQDDILTP